RKSSSRLPRARDSTRHCAATQTTQTRRQEQAAETCTLPAFVARDRWRRVSKFCWRQELGSSEQNSLGRILSNLARRHETVFPNCGRPSGQRKLGWAERCAEYGRNSQLRL